MTTPLSELEKLVVSWDGTFEHAEDLLEKSTPLFAALQETQVSIDDRMEIEPLIAAYQKLIAFLKQEKLKVQRETSKLHQTEQKMRDYVKFNQSSGYEFYY